MRKTTSALIVGLVAALGIQQAASACGGYLAAEDLAAWVERSGQERDFAIAELRWDGQRGVDALAAHHAKRKAAGAGADVLAAIESALDEVAAQRGAIRSRLFWHTDLEEALAISKVSGRPVLSLRLLGKLTEEHSCANSRFFRTILYADPAVSKAMREGFILHWSSERPAPLMTIDMGDGRTITRTITGNSIHYVLLPDGRVMDAVPGLYGPKAFIEAIGRAGQTARAAATLEGEERAALVRAYHQGRFQAIGAEWASTWPGSWTRPVLPISEAPPAELAMPIAVSKSGVEMRALRATALRPVMTPEQTGRDSEVWARMAEARLDRGDLSPESVAVIRAEHAGADDATIQAMLQELRRSVALDTIRNEALLHRTLHEWLAGESASLPTLDDLNARVYTSLFLTPRSDAWLGLHDPSVYTGLEGWGISRTANP